MAGVISDGPRSIRRAVAHAVPEGPHQLWHCHDRQEAAQPLYEADRHAKKGLTKHGRGVRPLARAVEGRTAPAAAVIRGSCSAVRRALTDDGRPPWAAAGRPRHARRTAIAQRLERGAKRGPGPRPSGACRRSGGVGWTRPLPSGPPCGWPMAGSIVLRTACLMPPKLQGPPCSGGGTGGSGPGGNSKPKLGAAHPRSGTFCKSAGATGQACCTARVFPRCPGPIMLGSSFLAPIAILRGEPLGARWLRPLWYCAAPSDSSPVRPPAYGR
jgi:hypothetical protein